MPRRTRRAETEVAAEVVSSPEDGTQPSQSSAEAPESTAKKPRTRVRRTTATSAAREAVVDASSDAASPEAAPAEQARPSRRARKKKSAEAQAAAAGAAAPLEAPDSLGLSAEADAVTQKPSGRGRRRRSSRGAAGPGAESLELDLSVESPASEPEAASGPATPSTTPPRRRIGGRRAAPRPPHEAAAEVDVEGEGAESTGEAGEESSGDEQGASESRRARRARRGGKRRGKGAPDSVADGSAPQSQDESALEDIDLTIPEFLPEALWRAPRIVPLAEELDIAPIDTRVKAAIDVRRASFVIDGQSVSAHILFVNTETGENPELVRDQIQRATAAGIRVISSVAYLPLKNARGERPFARTDELIAQILDAAPDAYILIRLQCAATNFWVRTHPGELARYSDGSEGDVSFASEPFWADAVGAAAALIEHVSDPDTPGGDRVIGFHLDKGEWFHDSQAGFDYSPANRRAFRHWLHAKYQNIYSLRAAWRDGSVAFDTAEIPLPSALSPVDKRTEPTLLLDARDRRLVDYLSYASDVVADAITGMAEAIKTVTRESMLVGASYGYTFEFAHRSDSGHFALGRVLASPHLDMIAGPISYSNRSAGGAGSFPGPVDSAMLHGKLWIVEDDTKTHLAQEDTDDPYNPKIGTPMETTAIHRRNLAAASLHGCGIAWMDLWGKGWLSDEAIWSELASARAAAQSAARHANLAGQWTPDVAVIVDESSYAYVRHDVGGIALQTSLLMKARDLLSRSGASLGFYLQSDIPLLPEGIKTYIFLNALRVSTSERLHIREHLQRPGKTLVWIYAPGLFDEKGMSPHEVSEIVGMALRPQPWNAQVGTLFTEERHPIIERLHGGKRMGTEEILNPSYTCTDQQAAVLGEYAATGLPSVLARSHVGGWKSVFIGEPHVTGELLRGIFRFAGVHLYDVQDDIVYATNAAVLVHAPYSGQRTVQLPRQATVYSFSESRLVVQQSTSFRQFMKGRTTHVFLYGPIESIAEALDMPVETLRETAGNRPDRDRDSGGGQQPGRPRTTGGTPSDTPGPPEYIDSMIPATEDAPIPLDHDAPLASIVEEIVSLPDAGTLPEGILGEAEPYDEEAAALDPGMAEPPEVQPTTPSRRRRWNRRNNARANRGAGDHPTAPIDDLLSDLAPRRIASPEGKPPDAA